MEAVSVELGARGAHNQAAVLLRYPNGRTIERSVPAERAGLLAGDEFTLVGRRWRVGHQVSPRGRSAGSGPRAVCVPVDALSPLLDFRVRSEQELTEP